MDREDIMGTPSPELKQLWIRVLKRVHPDLAVDEQDRVRCERLTKLANEAYQAGDEEALKAVLSPSQSWFWLSNLRPLTAFSFKQLLSVAIAVVILIGTGFSLYSATISRHAVTNSPTAQVDSVKAPLQAHVEMPGIRQPRPSTLADTTVGAPRESSPTKVSLSTTSEHPSLDSSCQNAAPKGGTFGSSEWGSKDSLDAVYGCSHESQDHPQAPLDTGPPVANSVEPSPLYIKQMRERLYQSFSNDEWVDANVPPGNSAEMWFDVNRDGSLSNVRVGKPSGWDSLDYACMRAVQRTATVGALPEDYTLRALPATFACTYTGSNALQTSKSIDSATDRRDLYVGSVRDTTHE
jgi:TonB family protein